MCYTKLRQCWAPGVRLHLPFSISWQVLRMNRSLLTNSFRYDLRLCVRPRHGFERLASISFEYSRYQHGCGRQSQPRHARSPDPENTSVTSRSSHPKNHTVSDEHGYPSTPRHYFTLDHDKKYEKPYCEYKSPTPALTANTRLLKGRHSYG